MTVLQDRTVTWIECFSELVTEYLTSDKFKNITDKWDLEPALLKKINPLYYKTEKGKRVEGSSPSFYPKLSWSKAGKDKNGKDRPARMFTKFYSEDDINEETGDQREVDPLEFLGIRCYVTAAIKIESVFLGSKNNTQCKVYESEIKAVDGGMKRLLKVNSNRPPPTVLVNGVNPFTDKPPVDLNEEEAENPLEVSKPLNKDKIQFNDEEPGSDVGELQESDDEQQRKKEKEKKTKKIKVSKAAPAKV